MKDSKEYSDRIRKLFRSLKREYEKVEAPEYDDPLEALVYGVISEHAEFSSSDAIAGKIEKHFIDLNDLRVSRNEEILDVFGSSVSDAKNAASTLKQVLNAVFDKYDMVSLEALFETGKRQAKKVLDKLEGASSFAVNYCFLTAMGGHAIPLTQKMIDYLRANELVHPESTEEEISGFLERQITASNAYTFYSIIRCESEGTSGKTAVKTSLKTKKKASKKAGVKKRKK